ncbi:MAG: hypothetical protein E7376_03200 [Clostridiales bacterium]|nr:hypothetical protein [Clostridiales bacterium]
MEKFKCENCGSSKYLQIEEDKCVCQYCGAKFNISKTVKDFFLSDLTKNKRNNVKFLEANVSEDEFYKKALMHLQINKLSPKDILDSEFSYVNYRYVFFAVFDVDFYSENYFNHSNTTNVSPKKTKDFVTGNTMCVKLTQDCPTQQAKLILNSYDELYLTSKFNAPLLKDVKINYPKKQEVDSIIENAINNHKNSEIMSSQNYQMLKKSKYNNLVHKISNLQILAVPEYYLEYTYKNQKYKLSSFAHELNIFGNIPKSNNFKKEKECKLKPLSLSTIVITTAMIVFALYNLLINKSIKLVSVTAIFFAVSIAILVLSLIISYYVTKKMNNKYFEEKKTAFITFAKKQNIQLTTEDENHLGLLKGGY